MDAIKVVYPETYFSAVYIYRSNIEIIIYQYPDTPCNTSGDIRLDCVLPRKTGFIVGFSITSIRDTDAGNYSIEVIHDVDSDSIRDDNGFVYVFSKLFRIFTHKQINCKLEIYLHRISCCTSIWKPSICRSSGAASPYRVELLHSHYLDHLNTLLKLCIPGESPTQKVTKCKWQPGHYTNVKERQPTCYITVHWQIRWIFANR